MVVVVESVSVVPRRPVREKEEALCAIHKWIALTGEKKRWDFYEEEKKGGREKQEEEVEGL